MIEILTLDTRSLGDRSYLVSDGSVAVVIDPQRDIDRVLELPVGTDVRITHVAETHLHNDYVTGGLALARQVGAQYLVAADDDVAFARCGLRDGDVTGTGELRLRALHTPGHTFTHLSYVLEDGEYRVHGVFTGGSLLFGSTGRPDLFGRRYTETLARHQYASARRLADELPPSTPVFPTHGFGSFCASSDTAGSSSTIGAEIRGNPVLTQDEESYVVELLAGLSDHPAYYAHMAPLNAAGPLAVQLSLPAQADAAELLRRVRAGEWVVDLRHRRAFAAGHLPGSVNIGINGSFVSHLGWLIPWGTRVSLVADTPDDVMTALRELCRIGIDRTEAMAVADERLWNGARPSSYRCASFADLERERAAGTGPFVLDVRRDDERRAGAVAGSRHIPLHQLRARVGEVPAHRQVWVHCAVGYRASIAASLLESAGRDVVLIDDTMRSVAPSDPPEGVRAGATQRLSPTPERQMTAVRS